MPRKDFYQEIVTALKSGWTFSMSENMPDPDPVLRKAGRDAAVYSEIRSDAKVSACIEQRKAGTLSLEWGLSLEEDQGNDKAQNERKSLIERALNALDMPKIISGILEAALWGFQPLEIMWELRDGLTLPKDVIAKPPEWFVFDYAGNLKFKTQAHPKGEELPERKFLLAQHQATFANPYGQKILPLCFWPVTFKKGGWRWWVQFTEKFGSPMLVGKYPRGIDSKEQDDLKDALDRLFQQAVASVPNDTVIETITSGSADGAQHKLLIDQCNNEIALAILGQTLTTEIGANGSYAAAKTHSDVKQEIIDGDKRMTERCLQQLVDWIYELNWENGRPPRFSMWHEEDVDRNLAERDRVLTSAGVRFTKSYFQRVYGFQDDDFEVVEPQGNQGAEFAENPLKVTLKKGSKAVQTAFNPDDYPLDGKELSGFGKALLTQILNMLDEASSFEDVRERLFKLYPQIDTAELEDSLARAFYIAHISGRLQ